MAANRQKANRYATLVALAILVVALLVVKLLQTGNQKPEAAQTEQQSTRGLNRQPGKINYSKHARCRMACRHISEQEVEEILKNGSINYRKSEIGERPECRRKYALEGNTNDGQRVRIIFAPCRGEVTVVTVIDLGQEWACDCQ
jgi:hypothetical protein